jgi:hypothetical protein
VLDRIVTTPSSRSPEEASGGTDSVSRVERADVAVEALSSGVRACGDELRTAATRRKVARKPLRLIHRFSALAGEKVARVEAFVRCKWGLGLVIERDRPVDRFPFDHRHLTRGRIPLQGICESCKVRGVPPQLG